MGGGVAATAYRLGDPRLPLAQEAPQDVDARVAGRAPADPRQHDPVEVGVDALGKQLVHLGGVSAAAHVLDAAVEPLQGHGRAAIGEDGRQGAVQLALRAGQVLVHLGVAAAGGPQVLNDEPLGAAVGLEG